MVITWDDTGKRKYKTGVDHGILFVMSSEGAYGAGVAWNGLTKVTEKPSGGEAEDIFADNIQYGAVTGREKYGVSIESFTYPDEFDACLGNATIGKGITIGQQKRSVFGLCYRSLIGNDVKDTDYGTQIHFVYGCRVTPSEVSHETVADKVTPATMSFEATTQPVAVKGHKPTSVLTVDSTKLTPEELKKVEDIIMGTDEAEPRLPTPDELATLLPAAAIA